MPVGHIPLTEVARATQKLCDVLDLQATSRELHNLAHSLEQAERKIREAPLAVLKRWGEENEKALVELLEAEETAHEELQEFLITLHGSIRDTLDVTDHYNMSR